MEKFLMFAAALLILATVPGAAALVRLRTVFAPARTDERRRPR
jgi:hypothetical protein